MDTKIRYNRIKEVLDERGIKQTWLAEKLGKTYRAVNLYTNNEVQPPIPVLYKIADLLAVSPSELLCDPIIEGKRKRIPNQE
ncbi:MAG: helix-turn-helix transcriptional regulator [Bacteroidales bacterium]|nr:helix-turn-helix transcriptional regulator [Bacteroidales bacterium]